MSAFKQTPVTLTLAAPTLETLQQRADALQLSLDDYLSHCLTLNMPALSSRR